MGATTTKSCVIIFKVIKILGVFVIYIYIYIFLRNKHTHTHIRERERGSNTKVHHNFTQEDIIVLGVDLKLGIN